jgi:hypothetical protein
MASSKEPWKDDLAKLLEQRNVSYGSEADFQTETLSKLPAGGQAGAARISGSRIGRFTTAAIAASAMSAYHIHW